MQFQCYNQTYEKEVGIEKTDINGATFAKILFSKSPSFLRLLEEWTDHTCPSLQNGNNDIMGLAGLLWGLNITLQHILITQYLVAINIQNNNETVKQMKGMH